MRAGSLPITAFLVAIAAWFLWLPLHDVLAYPDRIAVLPNLQVDAEAYDASARELARRRTLVALPTKHPPGWIALVAIVYGLAGPSYVAGKLISWTALVASVVLCAWMARRLYGAPATWAAALLCAASPGLRAYVGTLQYEVTTGALLLAVIALAVRAREAISGSQLIQRAVLAGAAASLLVLTRETFLLVAPLIAVWIAQRMPNWAGRGRAIAAGVLFLSVAMVPVIAWSTVQSIRVGSPMVISEKGSMVVELGNNPLANGTYNAPAVGVAQPTGLAFVRQYPQRASVLAIRKVLYFWGVLRDGWNVPHPAAVWIWRTTTGLVPLGAIEAVVRGGWLLAAFIASLWILGRDRLKAWWVLPASVAAIQVVHIVTLASYRFSIPVLPIVYVVVSGPLARVAIAGAKRLRAPALAVAWAALIVIAVAMQFQRWPLRLDYNAVDLDGLAIANVDDPVAGHMTRAGDAKQGERPIVLLPDEYLPRGSVDLTVSLRGSVQGAPLKEGVAGIAIVQRDGDTACRRVVTAAELPSDRFSDLTTRCELTHDGPATVMVFNLGIADLSVDKVRLRW